MERSQSYTSFETTTGSSNGSNYKNKNYLLSRTNSNSYGSNNNNNNNSNNNIYYNYKNKFASTSSLNLRKALEMRQTQLQKQQQQEQEQLQRQQWQLLYEQQRQQLQLHKKQLFKQQQQQQQLEHSSSFDNINAAPLYLSSLNGLQLLQKQRQKMFQRQKSTTSLDDLDFPIQQQTFVLGDNDNDDEVDGEAEDDDVIGGGHDTIQIGEDIDYAVNLRQKNDKAEDYEINNNNNNDLVSNQAQALQQKLLQFQRQRPYSEAAINYRATSPLTLTATTNQKLQSQSVASSPTAFSGITTAATMTPSLKATERHRLQQFDQSLSFDSATTSTPSTANTHTMSPLSARHPNFGKLKRDNSLHSDSSLYSSVDSLLESRKPDPEAILINLGFGPVSEDILSRIPKRFLKPSQLRGIDTEAFVRRLQLANSLADHSVLGYRGLIGNPDLPPSTIVAKIMQRFEVNERKKSMGSIEQTLR